VQVFEQAGALAEAGAGVQISPNASRPLQRVGLGPALARWGVKPHAWHQRRWDSGQTLLHTPLARAMEAAFGFPHCQMHRADLLDALAAALPTERLHLGHRLIAVDDGGSFVEASFDRARCAPHSSNPPAPGPGCCNWVSCPGPNPLPAKCGCASADRESTALMPMAAATSARRRCHTPPWCRTTTAPA
jgi:hypothetical protein